MPRLTEKSCKACEGGVPPLNDTQIQMLIKEVPDWHRDPSGLEHIYRVFEFKNYYQTLAFVNAIAWVVHRENHHPDLEIGYNRCKVRFSTHAIGGLTENDFICAAKVDALFSK